MLQSYLDRCGSWYKHDEYELKSQGMDTTLHRCNHLACSSRTPRADLIYSSIQFPIIPHSEIHRYVMNHS